MKCPLFHTALINDFQRRKDGDDDCLKEECACWDEVPCLCSVLNLSQAATAVGVILIQMASNVSHGVKR